jgi:hypothetical protein
MDPALKFVVDVQNSEAIKRLTTDINQQKDSIAALNAQLQQGAITQQQFEQRVAPVAQRAVNAANAIKQIEGASQTAGRGLSQLAYAVDDIQYGFNAIVNNIPGIVMGLGGGIGIAGAAGIAAVAINQLYKHFGELSDALGSAWSGIATKQLAEIREGAEAAAQAFEKLAKTPTTAKSAQADLVAKAITEGPTKEILRGVEASLQHERKPGGLFTDTQLDELATLRRGADAGFIDKAYAAKKTKEIEDKVAGGIIGDKNPATLLRLVKEHPENFPKDFVQDLENASPEGQRAVEQKRLDLAGARLGRKQEEKAADKDRDLVDKLNLQGKDNEIHGKELARQQRIQDLQDRRDKVQEQHHQQDLALQARKEQLGHPTQILSGAKAVVDMYQKAVGDAPLVALAKEAQKIQEDQRTELQKINKQLEKERRIRPQ